MCIPVAGIPGTMGVRIPAKSEKGIDDLIDIDFVPDRRMPSNAHSSWSLASKQGKLTISSACLARQLKLTFRLRLSL